MKVKIGVTWEGLGRPTLIRSLLSSLAPCTQSAIIFLNTVWLPKYSREVFSLKDNEKTCGVESPKLPRLSFLHPGPNTPATTVVPGPSLRALAQELARLINQARDLARRDERISRNLLLLFSFGGFPFSDVELVNLVSGRSDDPLTSLTDEFRLAHAKHMVSRLIEKDCSLYQVTYGPYIFLRDDSPTMWGASRLVHHPLQVSDTDLQTFLKSRAVKGHALPWLASQAIADEQSLGSLEHVGPEALGWRPYTPASEMRRTISSGEQQPLTPCHVKLHRLTVSLALGRTDAKGSVDLSSAQNLNMATSGSSALTPDALRYWRHTILRQLLNDAAKRGDPRAYILVVSGMDPKRVLSALRHFASSLKKSSLCDIGLIALDPKTLEEFATALGCSLSDYSKVEILLDRNLALFLNHQANLLKQ
jgi:hypothetical protein